MVGRPSTVPASHPLNRGDEGVGGGFLADDHNSLNSFGCENSAEREDVAVSHTMIPCSSRVRLVSSPSFDKGAPSFVAPSFSSMENRPMEQSFSEFLFDETVSATFWGRRLSRSRNIFFLASAVATFGFSYLLTRWLPKLKSRVLTLPACFFDSTHVLVVNSFGQMELVPLERHPINPSSVYFQRFAHPPKPDGGYGKLKIMITLDYRHNRFILDSETGLFVSINDILPLCLPPVEKNMDGLEGEHVQEVASFVGPNVIEIEKKSALQIFYNEILHPFYIFQVASFIIWIIEDYYLYAVVILVMATASAVLTVLDTKRNLDKMRSMSRFVCSVRVLRDGYAQPISSLDLVPGDILLLDEALDTIPCDGIIVNGDAIVDESMLTGETIPVTKIDITDEDYSEMLNRSNEQGHIVEDPRFCIYNGTKLLRFRSRHGKPAMVLVTRTGFSTTKGTLVQSILFPRPNNFRFYRDSMLFIAILAVIAAFGLAIAAINFIILGVGFYWILIRALDVITVVVPPALPATMAIGTVFAIKRLEKQQIYCISPPRINVASKIELICFDKTGTLTEEGLEILGILVSTRTKESVSRFTSKLFHSPLEVNFPDLLHLMATCHSIRKIHGRLLGDSLDLRMFEFTTWQLEELNDVGEAFVPTIVRPPGSERFDVDAWIKQNTPDASPDHMSSQEMGIIRQFDFCAKLRRMSVIVRSLSDEIMHIFTKGSPESMLEICDPPSIPADYSERLAFYAHHGYRVIGCAGKASPELTWVKAQKMNRDAAESGLTFYGFIIFENRLKPQTGPIIAALQTAKISCLMATGDNILTAISVGRASGLIPQESIVFSPTNFHSAKTSRGIAWGCVDDLNVAFDPILLRPKSLDNEISVRPFTLAVTGEFFEWAHDHLPSDYLQRVLYNCPILARMSPQQKQLLVEILQHRPAVVGFCGDGANDCGALKAADVGLSLSQAEASIAAPFTSKVQDISCVPQLLREGRASLVTSFCCFKYMTLYSMIQFTTLIFLYSFGSTLSDGQFVYVDLLLIVPLGVLMSRYAPASHLVPTQPTAKLISSPMLTSILGHILIQAIAQIIVFYWLAKGLAIGWVSPFPEDESNTFHPSTSVMFLYSAFLYIGTALVFSAGKPFRQRIYWPFVGYSFIGLVATLSVMFFPIKWFNRWLYLTYLPIDTRLYLVLAAVIYLVFAFVFDRLTAPWLADAISALRLKFRI